MFIYILVIVSAIITFLLVPWFKSFRFKQKEFTGMIVTLSATFVGVLFALNLDRIETEKRDERQAIKLLEAAIDEIGDMTMRIKDWQVRFVNNNENDSSASRLFMDNPISEPRVFPSFGNNPLMLTVMHYQIREAVMNKSEFMTRIVDRINSLTQSNAQVNIHISAYYGILWYVKNILELQLQYCRKDINECELMRRKRQLNNEYINITTNMEALKTAINRIIQGYNKRNLEILKGCGP